MWLYLCFHVKNWGRSTTSKTILVTLHQNRLKRNSQTVYHSICFLLVIVCVILYIIQGSRHAKTAWLFQRVFSKAGCRQLSVLYSRMEGTTRNSLAFLIKIFKDYFKIGQTVSLCIFSSLYASCQSITV